MNVVFDERAVEDLRTIYEWIEADSPRSAVAVVSRIFESVERLGEFPRLGRLGRETGTREWIIPRLPYIVVYEVKLDRREVVILAVFHGAQDR